MDNIGMKCRLPLIYTLWLIPNLLPQSNILRPLGIKVFSLCIQTNFLLSLSELHLGKSFGNLIYSSICMVILWSKWSLWLSKCLATVVLWLCLMSNMTLESIYDSVLCLPYILCMAPVTFQAIYQVITLACAP